MEIKAKHVLLLGAFIVLTLLGYRFLPKDEIVIQTNQAIKNQDSKNQDTKNPKIEGDSSSSDDLENSEMIYVHIEGAINFPGIKEVTKGTRLYELIEVAGGTTMDADTSKVNLASILKDEQNIYIPFLVTEENTESAEKNNLTSQNNSASKNGSSSKNNSASKNGSASQNNSASKNGSSSQNNSYQEGNLVNINSASIEELQTLEGIGPSMAQKIVTHREEVGYFNSIEEIKNVSGIGEAKFNKIKENITV